MPECTSVWPSGTPSENNRWISHSQPQPLEATGDLSNSCLARGGREHAVGGGSGDKARMTGKGGAESTLWWWLQEDSGSKP